MFILIKKKYLLLIPILIIFFISIALISNHTQSAMAKNMLNKTIVIDAGHGGIFPGKVAEDGSEEKDINLQITLNLASLTKQSLASVIQTRTSDTDLVPVDFSGTLLQKQTKDLNMRTNLINNAHADFLISIHCNSIPSPKYYGAQVFYRPNDEESKKLALAIQNSLAKDLKTTRKALVRNDTYIFKNTTLPAVIVECGFLSNTNETNLLNDYLYQQKIAHAIYLGISDYLN